MPYKALEGLMAALTGLKTLEGLIRPLRALSSPQGSYKALEDIIMPSRAGPGKALERRINEPRQTSKIPRSGCLSSPTGASFLTDSFVRGYETDFYFMRGSHSESFLRAL